MRAQTRDTHLTPHQPAPESGFKDSVKRRLSRFSYGTRLSFSSQDEENSEDDLSEHSKVAELPAAALSPQSEEAKSQSSHSEPKVKPEPRKSLIESISSSKKHGVKRSFTEFEEQRRRLNVDDEEPQRKEKRVRPNLNDNTHYYTKLFVPYIDPASGSSSEEQIFFPRDLWRLNPEGFSDTQLLMRDKFELTVIQIAPSYTVNIRTGCESITGTVLFSQTLSIEVTISSKTLMLSQWETFQVLPQSSCSITNIGGSVRAKLQLYITKP
jgi:hypothetical protein